MYWTGPWWGAGGTAISSWSIVITLIAEPSRKMESESIRREEGEGADRAAGSRSVARLGDERRVAARGELAKLRLGVRGSREGPHAHPRQRSRRMPRRARERVIRGRHALTAKPFSQLHRG